MPAKPQTWAVNNRQIARVLGLDDKPKTLALIGGWLARPDFPKKGTKGYEVLQLKEWHLQYLKIESRKQKAETGKPPSLAAPNRKRSTSNFQRPTSNAEELPPRSDAPGAGVDLFKLSPEELSEANRRRLLRNRAILLELIPGEPLSVNDKNELIAHGLIPKIDLNVRNPSGPSDNPDIFPDRCSQKMLCEYYKRRWPEHNINVYKQRINQWQSGGGLPDGAPFHPTPDGASLYPVKKCFDWFEQVMLPKYKMAKQSRNPELPGVAESEPAIDIISAREKDELEQIEFNRWERAREKGDYVHKTVALATGVAAVKRIHQLVKAEDERNLPKMRREKLAGLGIAADIVSVFSEWDVELARSITDKREAEMQQMAVTLPKLEKPKTVPA